jgi:NTP pyrophosphatase (non-canonical NTP hydrolase)
MTGNEYQKAAMRTAGASDKKDLLLNGVMGLNGESGECIDIVKKHLFQKHYLDLEHMAKELGDVAWYLAVTAYAIGYSLDDIFDMNVKKLLERYPDGFDAKRSMNRKAGDV